MASRFIPITALILIHAAASGFLVAAGWVPWTVPAAGAALALVAMGFAARRRRRPGAAARAR
jgi:hypothetical protein